MRYQTAAEFGAALQALTVEQRDLQFVQADAVAKKNSSLEETAQSMLNGLARFLKQYLLQMLIGFLLMAMALGSGLAYLYFQKEDRQFRLPTEVTPSTKATSSGRVTALALAPSGAGLAYVTENGSKRTLLYKETNNQRDTVLAQSHDAEITGVTLSIDGEWVYYVKNVAPAGELYVCSMRGGQSRKVLSNIASPVTFAPTGKEFAFVRHNGAESQIVIAQAKIAAPARGKLAALSALPLANANAPLTETPVTAATPAVAAGKAVAAKFVVATNIPPAAQRVLLSRHSPQFILPQAVRFITDAEMPRTATGKILHRVLRERLAGAHEQAGAPADTQSGP